MTRYFTIESIEQSNGRKVNYTGGRFKSDTPRQSAPKVFSKAYHYLSASGPLTLKIKIREVTQGSLKKSYTYKVSRISQKTTVERDGESITYNFTTRTSAI
jgi:hypothetical protein